MTETSERIKSFNDPLMTDMVQLKYAFMAENSFRFFRGTNHLFFDDLRRCKEFPPSPLTWICGDLHLENFGTYKSDNRQVYFDLNDFDEALLAPALLDIVRMVTSIFVAFESLSIQDEKAMHMGEYFIKKYSEMMAGGKATYIEPNTAEGIVRAFLQTVSQRKQKDILRKRTVKKKDKLAILLDDPRHFELEKSLKQRLKTHIADWLKQDGDSPYNYKVIDAVFRLAGTGSVGIRRYAILLKSLNEEGEKYLLLDMKESQPPFLHDQFQHLQPVWQTEAERIVTIQRRVQNRSPALLSTTCFDGKAFVIQEMQPTKDSIDFTLVQKNYRDMIQVIGDMAMLTASAQIRTASRQGAAGADDLISFGVSDKWQKTVLEYAFTYSRKSREQFEQFCGDFKNGLLSPPRRWDSAPDPSSGLAIE